MRRGRAGGGDESCDGQRRWHRGRQRARSVPRPVPHVPPGALRERPRPGNGRPAPVRALAGRRVHDSPGGLHLPSLVVLRLVDDRRGAGAQSGAAEALLHRLLDGRRRVRHGAGVGQALSRPARRDRPRQPADPPAHHRIRQARGAGRGGGRLRHRGQPAGHRPLFARCRRLSSARSVPALPGGALRRDRVRRPPGVPRPGRVAGVHRARPSRASPAAGIDARATAVRHRPDRMARLLARGCWSAWPPSIRPRRARRWRRRTTRTGSSG